MLCRPAKGQKQGAEKSLRATLLWAADRKRSLQICRSGKNTPHLTLGVLLQGLGLALRMQALVALTHRPDGLALRENVLNLGFAAREIAVGWYP